MKHNFIDDCFTEANYGQYYHGILAYLHATYEEAELIDPSDDGDECWELPKDFVVLYEVEDAETAHFSIGQLWFGTVNGKPVVACQNASPIGYYRKK
jgi:hypothetical protein